MKYPSYLICVGILICIVILISSTRRKCVSNEIFDESTEYILPSIANILNITKQNISKFEPSTLRHLYPHIWVCPSADFKGEPGYFSQAGQDEALLKILSKSTLSSKIPGIFVEIGALDGITFSNTLFFERMFDWRGVLIEAQPDNARKLLLVNRTKTVKIPFGICAHHETQKVECGPIGTYLSAIGITHIDFFSLHVGGDELSILLTMNWNIQIHYVLVENNMKTPIIAMLLKSRGFLMQKFNHCHRGPGCTNNILFVNNHYIQPNFKSICLPNIYPNIT